MIRNELKKIWTVPQILLLVVIGGILFRHGVYNQMQAAYDIPFEATDIEVGKEFLDKYGLQLDENDLKQVQTMYKNEWEDIIKIVKETYPQLEKMDFRDENERMEFLSGTRISHFPDNEETYEFQRQLMEEFESDIDRLEAYEKVLHINNEKQELEDGTLFRHLQISVPESRVRLAEIVERNQISPLPSSVLMNLNYVMEDFGRITVLLVLILVLPCLTFDHKAGIYPVIAATKRGKHFIKTQITAILISLLQLFLVWDILLYATYRLGTPYHLFDDCLINGFCWFDLTLHQYFLIRILASNILAIALALLFFVASSLCRNIVGMIVVAIVCWNVGIRVMFFLTNNLLFFDYAYDGFIPMYINGYKYGNLIAFCVLYAVIVFFLFQFVHRWKKADILSQNRIL